MNPGHQAQAPRGIALGAVPMRRILTGLASVMFALFVFFICFTFLRPSPYDFLAIPTLAIWFLLGIRLHRGAIVFLAFLLLYHLGLISALIPYLNEPIPTEWTIQSIYLMITSIFFVMFFSDDTEARASLATSAYIASCVFAALAGIYAYSQPGGILFTMDGRAAGVFEDPNVLGSFLTFSVFALLRRLLTRETRYPLVMTSALLLILTGLLLAFSRGAWGATVIGAALTIAFTYRSSGPAIRRRITILAAVGGFLVVGGLSALLADRGISETFSDRFTVTKDYDEGETGRFGNQRRSLPMLLERPGGFGPLRFRVQFGLDPHNSYIGGFANGGWLGGFGFIGIVLATAFVGLRLCFVPSPYQRFAHAAVPTALMYFLQAFQIDIDHWRHVYLVLGMVWGLECARLRWLTGLRASASMSQAPAQTMPRAWTASRA